MIRRPPRSTRTDTLFPYTTLFRSQLFLGRYSGVGPAVAAARAGYPDHLVDDRAYGRQRDAPFHELGAGHADARSCCAQRNHGRGASLQAAHLLGSTLFVITPSTRLELGRASCSERLVHYV